MDNVIFNLRAGEYRYVTFENRPHLVVPVVLLKEGVHCGSSGPLLYLREEIEPFAASWNGMPVPIFHPETENGDPLSCNIPEVLEQQNVGRLFNVRYERDALRGEIYVDVDKAEQVYPGLIDMLKDSKAKLEVSTGLLSFHEEKTGTFRNEEYIGIVREIRPDHLAILPGSKGACSWEDGCGIRANERKGGEKVKIDFNKVAKELLSEEQISLLSDESVLNEKYFGRLLNEMGMLQKERALYRLVDSLDNDMYFHYLEEIYDSYIVYRKEARGMEVPATGSSSFYKVGYDVDENGEASFEGDPSPVRKEVNYVPISNQEDEDMAKEKGKKTENSTPCEKEKLVNELIASEHTNWQEQDRVHLMGLEIDFLERLTPEVNEEAEEQAQDTEAKPDVNQESEEEEEMTEEQYIANAPPGIQQTLREGLRQYNSKKKAAIANILANKNNKFTEDLLKGKDLQELEMLEELARTPKQVSRAPIGNVVDNSAEEEEPLEMPTVNYESK